MWAAAERVRGAARGGRRSFSHAVDEYEELLAAIAATRNLSVVQVSRAAGLDAQTIRYLRLRAEAHVNRSGS